MMSMCWVKLKMVWITSSFWLVAGKSLRTIKLRYILWWTPIDYTTLVIYICISLGLSKVIDYTTSSKTKKASWAPQIISQDKILATFMTSPCIVGYSCGFHILLQISTTPPPHLRVLYNVCHIDNLESWYWNLPCKDLVKMLDDSKTCDHPFRSIGLLLANAM